MTFLLTTSDETGQVREFSAHLDKLEKGFDLVNDVMAMGHVLLQVGEPVSEDLQQLEQEWQVILQVPASNKETASQGQRRSIQRQLLLYEERIVSYELLLSRFTLLLDGILQAGASTGRSGTLVQHYKSLAKSCDRQISLTYRSRHQLQERLDQLNELNTGRF